MLLNPKVWLYGLISAIVTGSAHAVVGAFVKPEVFNLGAGLHDLLRLACGAGILGAATYLMKSPLPAIKADIESQKGNQ